MYMYGKIIGNVGTYILIIQTWIIFIVGIKLLHPCIYVIRFV